MIGYLAKPDRFRKQGLSFGRRVANAARPAGFAAVTLLTGSASAESLTEAMIAAYRSNPSFQAERFKVRAMDEEVPRALSGWRPRAGADAFYGANADRTGPGQLNDRSNETYGYGLNIEQPLFDGFRTKYAVLEAETNVEVSREDLRAFENEILLQVTSAYFDVLRDEGIVLYRNKNLTALRREVIGVKERLERGQVTATDLEQAKLRASRAQSDLDEARSNLRVAQLRYTRLTGREPKQLFLPKFPKKRLPSSLATAAALADRDNPIVASATLKQSAAKHAVAQVRGELLPSAKVVAGYQKSVNKNQFSADKDGFSVVGRVQVPLYQGGAVSARIRQSSNTAARIDREGRDARARIGEAVRAAWSTVSSSRARLSADKDAVRAGQRALDGVRAEQKHGRRTVLHVLDAERELVEARIRLLRTTRDLHVSAYALLRALGGLTIAEFAPGTERYDPAKHYRKVRNKWWGTATPVTADDALLGRPSAIRPRFNTQNRMKAGWSNKVVHKQ